MVAAQPHLARWVRAAAVLSVEWQHPVTGNSVRCSLLRGPHADRGSRPPPPPPDDVGVLEEFLLSDEHLAPDQDVDPVAAMMAADNEDEARRERRRQREDDVEVIEDLGATQECDVVSESQVMEALPSAGDGKGPAIHTSKTRGENVLVISDPQEPYALDDVLRFLQSVRKDFNIRIDNVVHVGDETDNLHGSLYDLDPDNEKSAVGELRWMRERMAAWYSAFPKMRICRSNHGDRWIKKAAHAQIPSQLLRSYHEILQAPQEWVWREQWDFAGPRMPWRVEHGHNGSASTRLRAIENQISTAHGHFHSKAGVEWIQTRGGKRIWGMATGCLIDTEAIAFKYNRRDRFAPILGCGVVLDGGMRPMFVPYEKP